MNKEKLKKIKLLYYPYKMLNMSLRALKKVYKSLYFVKGMKKNKNGRINIGFLVQMVEIWDKQIDVYESLLKRENVNVFLFVVPEYDFEHDVVTEDYGDNYFINNYPDAIKVVDNGKRIDLKKYKLDYLFYPRPYDHYLPPEYRSYRMIKFCKCCYIPYGLTGSDNFDDTNLPFFDNIYCSFMETEYQKELLKSHYRISTALGIKKVYNYGYPAISRFLKYPQSVGLRTITWTPRWSLDPIKGGSNFMKYYMDFIELVKNTDLHFIFRPHPLMFDELIKKGYIDKDFKIQFLNTLAENGGVFDINSPIEDIFKETDLLITDYSSIIPEYFVTNKPFIYCDAGIPLNKDYTEIVEFAYIAKNWDDVLRNIEYLKNNGDTFFEQKASYIQEKFSSCLESATLIADKFISGV